MAERQPQNPKALEELKTQIRGLMLDDETFSKEMAELLEKIVSKDNTTSNKYIFGNIEKYTEIHGTYVGRVYRVIVSSS